MVVPFLVGSLVGFIAGYGMCFALLIWEAIHSAEILDSADRVAAARRQRNHRDA